MVGWLVYLFILLSKKEKNLYVVILSIVVLISEEKGVTRNCYTGSLVSLSHKCCTKQVYFMTNVIYCYMWLKLLALLSIIEKWIIPPCRNRNALIAKGQIMSSQCFILPNVLAYHTDLCMSHLVQESTQVNLQGIYKERTKKMPHVFI